MEDLEAYILDLGVLVRNHQKQGEDMDQVEQDMDLEELDLDLVVQVMDQVELV